MSAKEAEASRTVVLLHGFAGTGRAWDRVIEHLSPQSYRPLALDLPGHGASGASDTPIALEDCVQALLAAAPERFALCGYSMGGRLALHLAVAAPTRVSRLWLIAASPGIEDPRARARRRDADRRLADELEGAPFERFIERWEAQPLFAGDPPEVQERAREDQRRNDPRALAAALRGLGTGELPPLWGELAKLSLPLTILVGERDAKFRELAERMCGLPPSGAEVRVLAGGHRLLHESPGAVARELERG